MDLRTGMWLARVEFPCNIQGVCNEDALPDNGPCGHRPSPCLHVEWRPREAGCNDRPQACHDAQQVGEAEARRIAAGRHGQDGQAGDRNANRSVGHADHASERAHVRGLSSQQGQRRLIPTPIPTTHPRKRRLGHQPKRLNFLAPRPGLEPGTYGITTSVPAVKPHR